MDIRGKTRVEVEQVIAEAKRDIMGTITYTDAIEAYKADLEARGRKPTTLANVKDRLGRWLPGEAAVSALSTRQLSAIYGERAGRLAVDSHRNELAEVKRFFRWLVEQGHLEVSPAKDIKPKEGRRSKGKAQLRRSEAVAFVAAAVAYYRSGKRGYEGALGNLLVLVLGLRSDEICTLKVRDVDEAGGVVVLWVASEDGKTANAARQVVVPGVVAELLRAQAAGKKAKGWLFPVIGRSKTGHRGKTWLREAARRVAGKAGVDYICPQGLRGTHATIARQAGATGHLVAQQLGHGSEKVTERHYVADGVSAQEKADRVWGIAGGGQ